MNNVTKGLTDFLKNKNIVTVGGVILIIAILYWGYNTQISRQVSPIRNIPIAAIEIPPGTEITEEMIDYVDVSPIVMQHGEDVVRSSAAVIGKYTDYFTLIPKGSLFYGAVLVEEDDLPDSPFTKIKDGDVVTQFPVTVASTFGNAILPGNKIDFYMSAVEPETERIIFGKFIENVEIVAVRDGSGQDVFATRDARRTPSQIIFGLDPIIHDLFEKSKHLRRYNVELYPVPHGGTIEIVGDTSVSSQRLRQFIEAFTEQTSELYDDFEIPDDWDMPDFGNDFGGGGQDDNQDFEDLWPE